VRLVERRGEPTRFSATVNLRRYGLPDTAGIVIEAYHNAYLERFAAGTVGQVDLEGERVLTGLESGDRPLFRVKVIGGDGSAGRLLAAIDEVRPEAEDDGGAAGSLLPLVPKSREVMGDEFWRVHFAAAGDDLRPELWVNREVQGLFGMLQNQDPRVTALIMPEVFRQVLRGLVEDEAEWTDEGKLGQWLSLAKKLHPDAFAEWDAEDAESSRRKRREWVDQVVKGFAHVHRFFDRFHEQLGAGAEGQSDE
jgi:hypothetical protein